MKNLLAYILLLPLLALSACSNEEGFDLEKQQPPRQALTLHVSGDDFTTYGAPESRATDNGVTITFENGDRVGVIALKGNDILINNAPYEYDGDRWAPVGSSEGIYYDSKTTTYIVYYPYSKVADGVHSVTELKTRFQPLDNQNTLEAYSASDLMLWTQTGSLPKQTLSANLTHAYAAVSLLPQVELQLEDGTTTPAHPSLISNISLSINGQALRSAYKANDGRYHYILANDVSVAHVRCLFTLVTETFCGELTINDIQANTRYISTLETTKKYTLNEAQPGDFYCKLSTEHAYLIPRDLPELTDAQLNSCIGIVYWVGNVTSEDALLKKHKSACTHGLVLSLHDATASLWSKKSEQINDWIIGNQEYKDIVKIYDKNKMCGYGNTRALGEYNTTLNPGSDFKVLPIDYIDEYQTSNPAPTSSSNWYWPSIKELRLMSLVHANSGEIAGPEMLTIQLSKAKGTAFNTASYWSSTEQTPSTCYTMDFVHDTVANNIEKQQSEMPLNQTRPLLAF